MRKAQLRLGLYSNPNWYSAEQLTCKLVHYPIFRYFDAIVAFVEIEFQAIDMYSGCERKSGKIHLPHPPAEVL